MGTPWRQRAWGRSPSSTPVRMWRGTPGRCSPTVPPPERCGGMGSPRPCGQASAIWTTWPRRWGKTRWSTGGRWSCPRAMWTDSARTRITMTPSGRSWTRAWRRLITAASGRLTPARPGRSAGGWAWRFSGTIRRCGRSRWSPAPVGWCSTRTGLSRCRRGRRRSGRAVTRPMRRWRRT